MTWHGVLPALPILHVLQSEHDWKLYNSKVAEKLKKYSEDGYRIVIFRWVVVATKSPGELQPIQTPPPPTPKRCSDLHDLTPPRPACMLASAATRTA